MNENRPSKYQELKELLLNSFRLERALVEALPEVENTSPGIEKYRKYNGELVELLGTNLTEKSVVPFLQQTNDLAELKRVLDTYPELATEIQNEDRFFSRKGDSAFIKLGKLSKRLGINFRWFAIGFGNLFRKQKRIKTYWTHEIRERALAENVYIDTFFERLLPFWEEILQRRVQRLHRFYSLDRELESSVLSGTSLGNVGMELSVFAGGLEEDMAKVQAFFDEAELQLDGEFASLRDKAGTIEFPKSKLDAKKLQRKRATLLGRIDACLNQQQLAFFALAEHWRLKAQNRSLIFVLQSSVEANKTLFDTEIVDSLQPDFTRFKKDLEQFTSIDYADKSMDEALKVKRYVKQRVPALIQELIASGVLRFLGEPLFDLQQAIDRAQEKHLFAVSFFEGKRLKQRSFQPVQTRELLKGSILVPFRENFNQDQKKFSSLLQKLNINLEEIQYAAVYCVDFYLSQKQDAAAVAELVEGLNRTVKKAEENLAFLSDLRNVSAVAFKRLEDTFVEQVLQYFEPNRLNQAEKMNQRRSMISRRKKQLNEAWDTTSKISKSYFRKVRELYVIFAAKYLNLRSLLGISYEKAPITTELSHYLSETKAAIKRLPLLYQKLFEDVPLEEERFYLPRVAEIQQLRSAYESWNAGRFSPACIVAEQGSGVTTILNFFIRQLDNQFPVTRLALRENVIEEEAFVKLFADVFSAPEARSVDDLIGRVLADGSPRIVVLENIHKLYLRSVGDFGNLQLLFKLVSQTNPKIFWVTSCYLYSWQMLDYTNQISGYFAHVVKLGSLTAIEVREAILKRHQLSGFSMVFTEPEGFSPKRNYLKMNEEERQVYLKELFFDELGLHVQNNLRLAFIFWLRSIQKVDDGKLYFQQKRLDFSFLNSLQANEITTLHAILLHGGLKTEEHSRIFRCSYDESFRLMMVMDDDGLLERQGAYYAINPLVYRMLVSQLKSLNFIY